jgi:hypothetical protein
VTLIRSGLVLLAILGTVLPFLAAQKVLAKFYPAGVTGTPIPLWVSLEAYGAASITALVLLSLCFYLLKKDREPTDKADGLDEREDLPY